LVGINTIKVGNTKNGKHKFWNNLQIEYWWRTQTMTWTTRHQMSSPRKYCWKKDWNFFSSQKKPPKIEFKNKTTKFLTWLK
jgi:hypothetical protein